MTAAIQAVDISKTFLLHNQNGACLPVLSSIALTVERGEAVVLHGPSGSGKSTLLRILYGNYRPSSGQVCISHQGEEIDIATCSPRQLIEVRRYTLGWVSQFLRVIPRVSALHVVMDPMLRRGLTRDEAERRARKMLARLNLPERLWSLAPATFSGGEQQRVNIARSLVDPSPILLLDEPTASLDAKNRAIVVDLIREARESGAAIVGIFHDEDVRTRVATRVFDLSSGSA